jgi:hypothetical protein
MSSRETRPPRISATQGQRLDERIGARARGRRPGLLDYPNVSDRIRGKRPLGAAINPCNCVTIG